MHPKAPIYIACNILPALKARAQNKCSGTKEPRTRNPNIGSQRRNYPTKSFKQIPDLKSKTFICVVHLVGPKSVSSLLVTNNIQSYSDARQLVWAQCRGRGDNLDGK